ncbi:hypothetical protein [Streptomyces sp. R41]|uniref:Uncharacterized protein n=1 Tax=Streptomyces sp. R41 TaxID=3238632 RepID=A0AB39R744_9ACTN
MGGLGGDPRQDLDEVFPLRTAGPTRVVSLPRPLASVNESFQDVPHGPVDARIVFEFPDGR